MRVNWRLTISRVCISAAFFSSLPGWSEESRLVPGGAGTGEVLATTTRSGYLSRHLEVLSADGYNHFRYVDSGPGTTTTRDLFYKLSTTLRIKIVGEGTTYLQVRGESGRSFASSYDYTGIGMHIRYWSFNLKSLFLGQRIGRQWEAQVGGLEYDRGAGTEATYADNDGWLEGYRVRYSPPPHKILPTMVSVTVGYAGDFRQPNVFARLPRLGDENYIQILASKTFGKNRSVSAEFDSLRAIRYTREAVHWQKLRLVIVDELNAETMIRITDGASFGWSGSLFKSVDHNGRVRLGFFMSDMPQAIFLRGQETIFFNGDSYVLGQRLGPTLRVIPVKDLELSLFGGVRTDHTTGPQYRGQIAVCYHFAGLLNRMLH